MTKEEFLTTITKEYQESVDVIQSFEKELLDKGGQEFLDSNKKMNFDQLPMSVRKAYIDREKLASLISYPMYLYLLQATDDEIQYFKNQLVDENKAMIESIRTYGMPLFDITPYGDELKEKFVTSYGKVSFNKEEAVPENRYYAMFLNILMDSYKRLRLRPIFVQFALTDGKIKIEEEFDDKLFRYYLEKLQKLFEEAKEKKPAETLQSLYQNNVKDLRSTLLIICSRSEFYSENDRRLSQPERFVADIIESTTKQNENYNRASMQAEIYFTSQQQLNNFTSEQVNNQDKMVILPNPNTIHTKRQKNYSYDVTDNVFLEEVKSARMFLESARDFYEFCSKEKMARLHEIATQSEEDNGGRNYTIFLEKKEQIQRDLNVLRSFTIKYPVILEDVKEELEEGIHKVENAPIPMKTFVGIPTIQIRNLEKYLNEPVGTSSSLYEWLEKGMAVIAKQVEDSIESYGARYQMGNGKEIPVNSSLEHLEQLEREFKKAKQKYDKEVQEQQLSIERCERKMETSVKELSEISNYPEEKVRKILNTIQTQGLEILKNPRRDLNVYSRIVLAKHRNSIMKDAKRLVLERLLQSLEVSYDSELSLDELQEKYNEALKEKRELQQRLDGLESFDGKTTPKQLESLYRTHMEQQKDSKIDYIAELEKRRKAIIEILNGQAKKEVEQEVKDVKVDNLPEPVSVSPQKRK